MNRTPALLLAALFVLAAWSHGAAASHAQNHSLTARAFVPAPAAIGMGDAGVAFPTETTAFFYNPAHLAHAASARPRIRFFGARGALSTSFFDQLRFYRDEIRPAADEGFDNQTDAEQDALYEEAYRLGRDRTFASGDVLLPTVQMKVGPLGVGAGLFAHSLLRYHVDGSAAAPVADVAGQGEVTGLASAALDLSTFGGPALTLGLSGKYTRRYLSVKNKLFDRFEEDENFYLFRGDAVGADLGALYEARFLPLPGTLRGGLAVFDVVSTGFDYRYDRKLTDRGPDDADHIAADAAQANEQFNLTPSYRVGLSYTAPSFLGLLGETGLAVDYLGYVDPPVDQTALAHLRIGAQARVAGLAALRVGLNQGYPSLGVGLEWGVVALDYAFYGQEEGRLPGQSPSYHHTVQVALGLF